jgi:gluconolactonase
MERVVSGLSFPVGLAAAPEDGLVIAEAGGACVLQVGADGNRRVMARVPGAPMGLARTSRGAFLVADNGGKYPPAPSTGDDSGADASTPAVYRVEPDGTTSMLLASVDDLPLQAPNGLCVDGRGGTWFTDAGWDFGDAATEDGSLCYIGEDGTPARVPTDLRFPAALAFDASGATLFATESMDGGIWAFEVLGPGRLGAPSLFASLGSDVIPSGIAVDADGRVLVCGHMSGCVHVLDSAGDPVAALDVGRSLGLAHLAFGGADLRTIYIAASASGEIFATTWDSPGLPLPN